MNQILVTKLKKFKLSNSKILKKIFLYRLQFTLSISFLFIQIIFSIIYLKSLNNSEDISEKLLGNYSIYRLYSENSQEIDKNESNLFGIIEIPSINLYYPIFSHLNEELLKVSPCRFYGESPSQNGNLCIAGHNYNNSLFFSNINNLKFNDEIYIYDNSENKFIYLVFDNYEVADSDLSPIFDYNNSRELTLVTCNNFNNNRIIIKAKQKGL